MFRIVLVAVDFDTFHCLVIQTVQVTIRVVHNVIDLLLDAFGGFGKTRKLLGSADVKRNDLLGFNAVLLGEDAGHVLDVPVVILELPVYVAFDGKGNVEVDLSEV